MQDTKKGNQQLDGKNKKGRNKKKNGGANSGANNTHNFGPNKKWDKSKLWKLCEDHILQLIVPS